MTEEQLSATSGLIAKLRAEHVKLSGVYYNACRRKDAAWVKYQAVAEALRQAERAKRFARFVPNGVYFVRGKP